MIERACYRVNAKAIRRRIGIPSLMLGVWSGMIAA
jgi:hypothetical protein